jgi:hypothetical protein
MRETLNHDFWVVLKPSEWPTFPRLMSYSTLLEIEACPRKWALLNGTYSQFGSQRGYPRLVNKQSVEGIIIHSSINIILRSLIQNNCNSFDDERVLTIMRKLEGYKGVIEKSIDQVLSDYSDNPRLKKQIQEFNIQLKSKIPEFRMRIQTLLARIPYLSLTDVGNYRVNLSQGSSYFQSACKNFSELYIEIDEIGWCGVVDLLTLSEKNCEIRDFKTGIEKEQHKTRC